MCLRGEEMQPVRRYGQSVHASEPRVIAYAAQDASLAIPDKRGDLRWAQVSKETYSYGKTGLITLADLSWAQVSKETYSYGKRGLVTLANLRRAEGRAGRGYFTDAHIGVVCDEKRSRSRCIVFVHVCG